MFTSSPVESALTYGHKKSADPLPYSDTGLAQPLTIYGEACTKCSSKRLLDIALITLIRGASSCQRLSNMFWRRAFLPQFRCKYSTFM